MGLTSVESRSETREKTIVLKIENFADYLKMSNKELEENGVIFNVGNCTLNDGTEIPATWKFSFEHTNHTNGQMWFGGFLVLHRPTNKSEVKSASASWSVRLSSGATAITNPVATQRNEFAGTSGLPRSNQMLTAESQLLQYTRPTNTLEATLLVKVFSDQSVKQILRNSSPNSAEQLRGQMTSDLIKMLESGEGADVEIKVLSEIEGDVEEASYVRKVHKGILMARSSVFAKMFAKDSTMTEAKTGKVVIKDLSPKGLDVFLHYLYTGEVLKEWGQVGREILNAAEKYDCGQLKEYCGLNIMDAVSTSNAMELYKSAKLHGLTDAVEGVVDFISMNTKAVLKQALDEIK